ncbi:MAG: hypothetical protein KatS3mg126_1992 [Lysobacteraceae bacterium]|nr:MAG: hypothetical protein KatS3mg126_1992 [Xanthomonadaceae bacterium]
MPPLDLGKDLGIERAEELKQQLLEQVESGRSVVLDGASVERVHGAAMQLLAAFFREREAAGRKTRIDAPSSALSEAARVMALSGILGLPESGD